MDEEQAAPMLQEDFPHRLDIATRWSDNDAYGHLNNVVYYAYFDTVVNQYLISQGVLDVEKGAVIGLVVETGCRYYASAAFPEPLVAGLRVVKLGNSSVRYEIALFNASQERAIAQGFFVHVYVDRDSRRPVALPPALRAALQKISVA
ncbi:MAG: thioesterase family protein [Betaproteobacteria bacterium]